MRNKKSVKREKVKLLPSYYYEEDGKIVLTEEFHINRGHCCGNFCRHCPYEPKAQKGNTILIKKTD